jgi:D-alanyl-D-alanine carboxypeptidase
MMASRALCSLLLAAGLAAPASAQMATPAIVVDVDSGRVLHQERATDPWYPASITKLMTTYVALQAVREGRATMDQLLVVTPYAASMRPSKMAFKPGTEVTLENALKIILVKSANDVSVTIAEGLGGSVEGFAVMMNDAARRLGMRESHFVNPHGLPDERQVTSARDMAILGRALIRDFPEYRGLFSISAIQYGRRVMANHNGLVGRYDGTDGMKTGFICSSGFNVVASATRYGRRLITVVLGSPSARERTFRAADLFDKGFTSGILPFGGWNIQTPETLPASAATSAPDMRPYICGPLRGTPSEEDGQTVASNAAPSGSESAVTFFAAPSAGVTAPARRVLGPRAPLQPVLVWTGRSPSTAVAEEEASETPRRGRKGRKLAQPARGKPSAVPPVTAELRQPPSIATGTEEKPKAAVSAAPRSEKAAKEKSAKAKPAAGKASAERAAAKAKPKAAAIAAKPAEKKSKKAKAE